MIDIDSIIFNYKARKAFLVTGKFNTHKDEHYWASKNASCESCYGSGEDLTGETFVPNWETGTYDNKECPNCINGKIPFDIEVDIPSGCGKCNPWNGHLYGKMGGYGETCISIDCHEYSSSTTYSVTIVEILPILKYSLLAKAGQSFIVKLSAPKMSGQNHCVVRPTTPSGQAELIMLPMPAAQPGKHVVFFDIHKRKETQTADYVIF